MLKKHGKSWFQPEFGVCSNETPVKIYNYRCFERVVLQIELKSTLELLYFCSFMFNYLHLSFPIYPRFFKFAQIGPPTPKGGVINGEIEIFMTALFF